MQRKPQNSKCPTGKGSSHPGQQDQKQDTGPKTDLGQTVIDNDGWDAREGVSPKFSKWMCVHSNEIVFEETDIGSYNFVEF